MVILYMVLVILDGIASGLLPYLFLAYTERTIYKKKRWTALLFLLFVLSVYAVMLLRNDIITIVFCTVFYVMIGQLLFHKGKTAAFYQAVYMIVFFVIQIFSLLIAQLAVSATDIIDIYIVGSIILLIKFMFESLYTMFITQAVNLRKAKDVSKRQLLGLFLIPVYSIFAAMTMISIGSFFFLRYGYTLLVVHMIILLAIDFYSLYLYYSFYENQEMRRQFMLYQQQNRLQYKYYETLDKRLEASRKVIHDIRNHMLAIEELYKSGDIAAGGSYVKDVHEMLDKLGLQYYTGNRMLNMILNDKLNKAKQLGISTKVACYRLSVDFIADMDITTIFSNLLDNAVEAASKLKDGMIEIKSSDFNDMMFIYIKNSTDDISMPPDHRSGKRGHEGIGLDNVRRTLKKYHGTLDTEIKNGIFTASLMFPKQGA